MKQNKILLNRMEKEFYCRKQALLMLLFKICEHCLAPKKEENTIEEVLEHYKFNFYPYLTFYKTDIKT